MGKRTLYSLESDIRRILEGNDFISTSDEGGKQWYMNLVTDLANFVQREIEKAREEGREKIKQMVLTDCFKDQPDIQRYIDFIEQLLSESKEKAKIEVLEKVLEKKTNYEMEREEHGYRVTLEYVLADDIKKEIKLLKEKE